MSLAGYESLNLLPFSVCICGREGLVEHRNNAAAATIGSNTFLEQSGESCCGSIQLYRRNGVPLARHDYPVEAVLRGEPDICRLEVLVAKPDGNMVEALALAAPRRDADGAVQGAVCILVELDDEISPAASARHWAAVVDSAGDAIVSTGRDLTIAAWNSGATGLFGHDSAQVVGRAIGILVPNDRQADEAAAMHRVLGEGGIERFDTERVRSDGSRVDVSVTMSPIRNHRHEVIGVSQVSRDFTDRQRTLERQELLIGEMNHRVKNLLVLAGGIVSLGARTAKSVRALASDVTERFAALARAHELTLPRNRHSATGSQNSLSLHALIETILAPFDIEASDGARRISISGDDVGISSGAPMTGMALLLHEFATNAAKHGALATPGGTIDIHSLEAQGRIVVTWTERGGPPVSEQDRGTGFGSRLIDLTVRRQLSADLAQDWRSEGLVMRLSIDRGRLTDMQS